MKRSKLLMALFACALAAIPVGAIDITQDISGQTALNGGAFDNSAGGIVNISDGLTFENNTSTNQTYGGGAIYSHNGGTINIGSNVSFIDNYINQPSADMNDIYNYSAGGAIAGWGSTKINIENDVTFSGNGYSSSGTPAAAEGGAIYLTTDWATQGTLTTGTGTNFSNNSGAEGGALYLECAKTTMGDGANFYGNKSLYTDGGGGAIYAYGTSSVKSTIDIGQANFEKNTAKGMGGAICTLLENETSIGDNSTFKENEAGTFGGAIYNDSKNFELGNNITFSRNTAQKDGGAIYNTADWVDKSTITIGNGAKFENNKANGKGGAIYNDSEITLNGATFKNNSAQSGGAIYNTIDGITRIENVIVEAGSNAVKNDIFNAGSIIANGNNTLNSDILGTGSITNNGTLTLGGNNSKYTGEYTNIAGAVTTVTGTYFGGDREFTQGTLNWKTESDIPGTLKVSGNNTTINIDKILNLNTGSSIAEEVTTNINTNSTLKITGGDATLNTGDTWDGDINLSSGSLTVNTIGNSGKLNATGGDLVLTTTQIVLDGKSQIADTVKLETIGATSINIKGVVDENGNSIREESGYLYLGNDDKVSATTNIALNGGTLDYAIDENNSSATIQANTGNLNLLEGAKLTFNGGAIANEVNLSIGQGAELALNNTDLYLDKGDSWNGTIKNTEGTINADNLTKTSSASLIQEGGTLNLYNDTNLQLGEESLISGGIINIEKRDGQTGSILTTSGNVITGGDMTIDEFSKFVVASGSFNLDSLTASADSDAINVALINTMNGERNLSSITSMTVNNQANFNIDILARGNHRNSNDQFIIGSLNGDGKLMVSDWGLNGDLYGWDAPIDRHITLGNIFITDENGTPLEGSIEVTDKTTFTPIGWYQLNQNNGANGINYTLDLVKYNPQVFRGQVATVAQWMNQLNIDDMLFTHSMVLPSFKEENGKMANNYAAINPLFAPYQYSIKDGGLWYKMYGTFENLNMNNGLGRVGNNAYGALVGADFGLKDLKNGWKFMPTAYIGYNGAHQTFARMGQYQNGGQAGFLGTWYKDNFIIGALAYGGIYDNQMDVRGFSENTFNYFAGAATKAAYNIRLSKNWVLQPNLMAAYNFFGQQNWHSDFGQMGMMAGMLHGVNVAPGLNLIWEKETFSAYATLQYMYNINGACGGRAGNVNLPHMVMDRGYIQYGIGFTKKFTDRASGYLQAVLRNVGRTGVGFQMGFNFKIGK